MRASHLASPFETRPAGAPQGEGAEMRRDSASPHAEERGEAARLEV